MVKRDMRELWLLPVGLAPLLCVLFTSPELLDRVAVDRGGLPVGC